MLGAPRHLLVDVGDETSYSWVREMPTDVWTMGAASHPHAVEDLITMSGASLPHLATPDHRTAFRQLGVENLSGIPWRFVLGQERFDAGLRKVIQAAQNAVCYLDQGKYAKTYIDNRKFLQGLVRTYVNLDTINRYIDETTSGPSVISSLKSFLPDNTGQSKRVLYDQIGTTTGRLTVKSGPAILTLPQKYRDVLSSRHAKGKVVQIDFVSVEPRVLSRIMGKEPPADIYNHINQTLFNNDLTRAQVKLAVLSAMYGVSHTRLSEMMQSGSSKSIIRSVRRYFEIDRLERELRSTAQSVGKIFNYFGRPLDVDLNRKHVLVSHFVQSTASDLALIGFSRIAERLDTLSINFNPIFVIHDALLIDTDEEGAPVIEKLCQTGLDHELGNFPLSMTTVSSENT
jgi:hypothetical protein